MPAKHHDALPEDDTMRTDDLALDATDRQTLAQLVRAASIVQPDVDTRQRVRGLIATRLTEQPARRGTIPTAGHWRTVLVPPRRLPLGVGLVLGTLALLIIIVLTTPTLRAMALSLLGFTRADADTVEKTVTITGPPITPLGSMAELVAVAGYHPAAPAYLPDGFVFRDGMFYAEWPGVTMTYERPGDEAWETIDISVSQWLPGRNTVALWPDVGASAAIEQVTVNGQAAEYVQGVWEVIPDPWTPKMPPGGCDGGCTIEQPTPAPGDTWHTKTVWNGEAPVRRVRWQDGEWMRSVSISGDEWTRDDLLRIAESVR